MIQQYSFTFYNIVFSVKKVVIKDFRITDISPCFFSALKRFTSKRFFNSSLERSRQSFSPLGALMANHVLSYPTPASLSYFWGFGSLSGLCLGLQLLSGIFLAMHYQAGADVAFASVEHIMRDVQGG